MRLIINNNPHRITIESIYTVTVALLPVFASYASGIPGFSLADIILCFFAASAFIFHRKEVNNVFVKKPYLIALALYLIIMFSVISLLLQSNEPYLDIAIRTIRYFFYLSVIVFCSRKFLIIDLLKRAIKAVALFATIYIFVQLIAYNFFDIVLKGFVSFMDLYVEDYATKDYAAIYSDQFLRPTSFFLEPAHYARYAVIGLIIMLFDSKIISSKDMWEAIIVTIGILISTSAQGYALAALIWLIWLFGRVKNVQSRNIRYLCYFAIIAMPLILFALMNVSVVQDTVIRVVTGSVSNKNTALGGRLADYIYFFDLEPLFKIIGMGFGNVPEGTWFPSAVYWLYSSGIIVFALYIIYGCSCFMSLKNAERYILLVFMLLFFTDDSFYSYMCIIFVSTSLLRPKYQTGEQLPDDTGQEKTA